LRLHLDAGLPPQVAEVAVSVRNLWRYLSRLQESRSDLREHLRALDDQKKELERWRENVAILAAYNANLAVHNENACPNVYLSVSVPSVHGPYPYYLAPSAFYHELFHRLGAQLDVVDANIGRTDSQLRLATWLIGKLLSLLAALHDNLVGVAVEQRCWFTTHGFHPPDEPRLPARASSEGVLTCRAR